MADGDISAPDDTLIWNALAIEEPRPLHVSGDVYAFAFEESPDLGRVGTVAIDSDGLIGAALEDVMTYESVKMEWPDIVHVSGNVFAIVHSGVDVDGFIRTVTIHDNGLIDDTEIDSWEFEETNCRWCRIFHVAGTTFGVTYSCDYKMKLVTITIAADGTITKTLAGSQVYDATSGYSSIPIKLDSNVFAFFYCRLNSDARIVTLTIADNGAITATELGSLEVDGGVNLINTGCLVQENIYAFIFQKSDYFYYVTTVNITATGTTLSVIATFKLEPAASYGSRISVLRISDTIICVAYSGPDNDGFMKTIEIDAAGAITDPVLDTSEFDEAICDDPVIIAITADVYAVFYRGTSGYGTIITPGVVTPGEEKPGHLMMMGVG